MKKLVFILIIAIWNASLAQSNKEGGLAFPFLKIGVGARNQAMGNIGAGLGDDIYTIYYNPAGLARLYGKELSFMHDEWVQDINHGFLGFSQPFLKGVFGISFEYINYGSFERRDEFGVLVPGKFTPYNIVATTAYGEGVLKCLSLGFAIKAIREGIDYEKTSAYAFDMGLLYQITNRLNWGLVFQNIGSDIKGFPLPFNITSGISYRLNRVLLAGDVFLPRYSKPKIGLGLECFYSRVLALRTGLRCGGNSPGSGFSIGTGLRLEELDFDYAWVPYGDLGNTHRIQITYRLPKKPLLVPKPPPVPEVPVVPEVEMVPPVAEEKLDTNPPLVDVYVSPQILVGSVTFSIKGEDREGPIKDWILYIKGEKSRLCITFSGKGQPPPYLVWEGKDREGRRVKEGYYYYTLRVEDISFNFAYTPLKRFEVEGEKAF